MTAKLIEDMDIDAYHAFGDIKKLGDDAVLSKSMLKIFDECPAKFEDQFILGHREEQTRAMEIGNAVHLYSLQRELFDAKYYIMPEDIKRDVRTKAYQEQLAIAAGRIDLKPSEMTDINGMAEALGRNKKALLLLDKPGMIEASIFWTDPETGLKFRCRPDFIGSDGILTDLKATGRADNKGIENISYDKRYDLSVALTVRGYKAKYGEYPQEYVFLFVETDRPYVIEGRPSFVKTNYQGGKLSKSYWQIGEERLSRLLDRYMRCRETGFYPGYNTDFMPMVAPDFQVRKLYETEDHN